MRNHCFYSYLLLILVFLNYNAKSMLVNANLWNLATQLVKNYVKSVNLSDADSHSCFADIRRLLTAAFYARQPEALTMLDAWGKPETGILDGNLRWEGNYMECQEVHGHYCWLDMPLSSSYQTPAVYMKPSIQLAVCAPDTCQAKQLQTIANHIKNDVLGPGNWSITVKCLHQNSPNILQDKLAIAAVLVLCFFALLMLVGTIIDLKTGIWTHLRIKKKNGICQQLETNPQPSHILKRLLLCFSVTGNGRRIFSGSVANEEIGMLHGIRAISMCGVVFGNSFNQLIRMADNTVEMGYFTTYFRMQVLVNLYYVVDFFTTVTGFLTIFVLTKDVIRVAVPCNFKFIIGYVLHRYWRLVHTMGLVILVFQVGLFPHLGSGPFWENPNSNCYKTFWTNLLFINNLWTFESGCDTTTWYLANAMQLHIISVIIIIPLFTKKHRHLSIVIGLALLLSAWFYTGYMTLKHDLPPPYSSMTRQGAVKFVQRIVQYKRIVYQQTYFHIGPYLIGMATGYFIVHDPNRQFRLTKSQAVVGWALAVGGMLAVFHAKYFEPTGICNAIFQATSGTLCSAALAFIIIACYYGHGGVINSILTWKMWLPLSRLGFSIYAIHATVMSSMMRTENAPLHFSGFNMFAFYLRNLVMSVAASVPICLAFEAPFLQMEKLIIEKLSPKKTKSS